MTLYSPEEASLMTYFQELWMRSHDQAASFRLRSPSGFTCIPSTNRAPARTNANRWPAAVRAAGDASQMLGRHR
jgi:hypothetical protein